MATVFGAPADAAATVRPGKFGWLDFAREVIPEVVNSPILNSLANRIAAGTPAAPLPNPAAPATNGTAPNTADTMTFVQAVVTPAMLEYFRTGNDGGTFAAWIADGYPARLAELQSFGEQRIFELYKTHSPRGDWAVLTSRGEQAFAQFIHEFCGWKPEPEEGEEPAAPIVVNGIIDLDQDDKEEKGA